jgi:hypothetical protein
VSEALATKQEEPMITHLIKCVFITLSITTVCSTPAATDLQISLASPHGSIAVLEGLPVTITLKNAGGTDLMVDFGFLDKAAVGSIAVTRADAHAVRVLRPVHAGDSSSGGRVKKLAPGADLRLSFLFCCDFEESSGSVFATPGEYRVSVEYDDGHLVSQSNTITVQVVEPPPEERDALALVRKLKHPNSLYEPDVLPHPREQTLAELEQIANIKESKIYGGYARVALAWRHLQNAMTAWHVPEFADRARELEAAESLLNQIQLDGFTLANKARELRSQLEELKAAPTGPAQQNSARRRGERAREVEWTWRASLRAQPASRCIFPHRRLPARRRWRLAAKSRPFSWRRFVTHKPSQETFLSIVSV